MHSNNCQRKLVPVLPLCVETVKPGQLLKIVELTVVPGSCSISLLANNEIAQDSLITMEAEGWISAPMGRYLALRLPFGLTCEDDEIDVCPLRIVGKNTLACLTDAEYAHVAKHGKLVSDFAGLEEYICI
jgi:hypothetical protein